MPKGTIIKYTNRGFGFIRLDRAGPDAPDIFFHVRDFFCGDFGAQPQVDDIVVFKIVTEHKDKRLDARPSAIRVRLIVRDGSFWCAPARRRVRHKSERCLTATNPLPPPAPSPDAAGSSP